MGGAERSAYFTRIDELLGIAGGVGVDSVYEAYHGTLTLTVQLYGAGSSQEKELLHAGAAVRERLQNAPHYATEHLRPVVTAGLRSRRREVESGLLENIRRGAAGEVLGDMLGLAREALREKGEGPMHVAAVLVAAAYEDTIRKVGAHFAGVHDRRDLEKVLIELRKGGVLVDAPATIAQGYLKFRNDALHADWTNLDRAAVGSCLAFVEGLLLKHFS